MTAIQLHPTNRMPSAPPLTSADLERLERYIAMDPGNAPLLVSAIDTALASGGVAAARKHADAAMKLQPQDPFVQHRHGSVLIAEGRLDEAAEVFEALLAQHREPNVAFNLAFVRFRQGRFAEARSALEPYIATTDTNPRAMTLYLRTLHHLGDTEAALQVIDANTARCANEAEFLAVASLICLDEDRLAQAAELSQAALAGGLRMLEAIVTAGSVSLASSDLQDASRLFDEALKLQPNDGRSWAGQGMASLLAGDAVAAGEQLQRAAQLMPSHTETLHALGWCQISQGDLAQAQETFLRAKDIDPEASEPHGGLAVIFAMQQRRGEAQASCAAAERIDANDAGARFARAILAGAAHDMTQLQALAQRSKTPR